MIRYTYGYSRDVDPDALYWHLLKRAAAVMTPEAMQAGPAGMPPQGAPMDPSMMGAPQPGMMPPGGDMGGMPPEAAQPPQGTEGMEMPPEIMQQVQKTIDDSIRAFSAQLDKKLSALLDKIDVIKDAIEEYNNTDDRRSTADKEELRGLQEDLRNELEPSGGVKTASTKALNVFDLI